MFGRHQLHESAKDFVAVAAVEGEGELSGEEAVFNAEIVTASVKLGGEIAFVISQQGEHGAEVDGVFASGRFIEHFVEETMHRGSQDVHAEKAEVIAGAQAGDIDLLFGFRGGWFFQHGIHQVKSVGGVHELAADCAVVGKLTFVRALNRRDRAFFGPGAFDKLLCAAFAGVAEVKVIANEQEKRILSAKRRRATECVRVAERFLLFDEREIGGVGACCDPEGGFIAGSDDDGDLFDPCAQDLLYNNGESGFVDAVAVNEALQGKGSLTFASSGDHGFLDIHGRRGDCMGGIASTRQERGNLGFKILDLGMCRCIALCWILC